MPKQEPKFFTKKQLEPQRFFLRYRWEFMRRDPEYMEAYQKALELRGKTPTAPQIECVRVSLKNSLYHETKEHEKKLDCLPNFFNYYL